MTHSPRLVLLGAVLGGLTALGVAGCDQPVIGRAQTTSVPASSAASVTSAPAMTEAPSAVADAVTAQAAVVPVAAGTTRRVVVRTTPPTVVPIQPAPVRTVVVTVTAVPQPLSPQEVAAAKVNEHVGEVATTVPVRTTVPPVPADGDGCTDEGATMTDGAYVCATTAADPRLRWRSTS